MSANTNGKHEIRKRFALVIGVAAVGVMALGYTNRGRGRGSGAPAENEVWSILWLAEGLIARRQAFRTGDEALEAAGLSE